MNIENEISNCSGCTDRYSEGTHQMHTIQHPCPPGGDPGCGYCFPVERDGKVAPSDGRDFSGVTSVEI